MHQSFSLPSTPPHTDMNISEFSNIFLPQLVKDYSEGNLDFHALVDFDLWKQVFISPADATEEGRFLWYQIQFNSFELRDHTMLLTYTLPIPIKQGLPKFIGIRIDRTKRIAHYYVLTKPQNVDDAWDIFWMPFPKASSKMKLEFKCKIDGTDSLRNFVLSVQHLPFIDQDYDSSLLSSLLRHLKDTVIPLDE